MIGLSLTLRVQKTRGGKKAPEAVDIVGCSCHPDPPPPHCHSPIWEFNGKVTVCI